MTQKNLWSCFAGNTQNAVGIFSTLHFYVYRKNRKIFTAKLKQNWNPCFLWVAKQITWGWTSTVQCEQGPHITVLPKWNSKFAVESKTEFGSSLLVW